MNTTIPNSVTSIGERSFEDCSSLTSITIPESVTSIGEESFRDCSGLTSITIPKSVTSIEEFAFYNCSGLTSITIPKSVTNIGSDAFGSCNSLLSIVVENENTAYDSREGCNAIIEIASNTLIAGCMNTTIPNSVTSIGDGAFEGCIYLTSITIPNFITSIGEDAFYACEGLTSITIPKSVTSIGEWAFEDCCNLTSVTNMATTPQSIDEDTFTTYGNLYVPKGAKVAYEAADYWKNFTIKEIDVTAIEQADANNTHIVGTYTLDGKRSTTPQRGVRIIRYSDGTTKKVM